jgi:hypothetical protein
MPKYVVHIETENLSENQLRLFNYQLSQIQMMKDELGNGMVRDVELAELINRRLLDQHIIERVR